jgi:hypothetical protein
LGTLILCQRPTSIDTIAGLPYAVVNIYPALVWHLRWLTSGFVSGLGGALLQAFVLPSFRGLAAFRPTALALDRRRMVQLAGRIDVLLSWIPSEPRKYLGNPANEKAAWPIGLSAFRKPA